MITITIFQAIYIIIAFALLLIGCYIQIWWIKKGYNDKLILTYEEYDQDMNEVYQDGFEDGKQEMRKDIFNFEQAVRTVQDEDCD